MFAPPVAETKAKSAEAQRMAVAPQQPAGPTRRLQGGAGNQAHPRVSRQRPAAPVQRREEMAGQGAPGVAPGVSWNFASVPISPPGRTNRVRNLLAGPIQAKSVIGGADDPLEHEADRTADRITHMSAPAAPPVISRKCLACDEEENLQKKPAGVHGAAMEAPAIVHEALRSSGQPLDAGTRAYFEPRFGCDFSTVRIHLGAAAEQSAQALNANAYTSGHRIVFGAGQFAPATQAGRRLIAHELTHVVQQKGGGLGAIIQRDTPHPPPVEPDFDEEVLKELQRLPAAEEKGISEQERRRRVQVLADRRERLAVLFAKLPPAKADRIYERLRVRRTGDVLSERFHDILATATRKDLLQVIGLQHALASETVPDPGDFCRPFSKREIDQGLDFEYANAMDRFVNGDLREFFGDEAAGLYDKYLTSTKPNVSPVIFDKPGSELVQSFINHEATAKRQEELAAIFEKNLPNNCGQLPPNVWVEIPAAGLIPREELKVGFSFSGVTTIPGIVAGGISSGAGSVDSRTVSVKQVLLQRKEVAGQTTGLQMQAHFHFVVEDAVDFCPGNMGSFFATYITIPLSRLEASGMAFSVPFVVRYDGPVLDIPLGTAAMNACK